MTIGLFIVLLTLTPIVWVAFILAVNFRKYSRVLKIFALLHLTYILLQIPYGIYSKQSVEVVYISMNVFWIINGCGTLYFFYLIFKEFVSFKRFLLALVMFTLLMLLSVLLVPLDTFNTAGSVFYSSVSVILSITTFGLLIRERHALTKPYLDELIVWICSGIFIMNLCGMLLIFFSKNLHEMSSDHEDYRALWIFYSVIICLGNMCYVVGLRRYNKKLRDRN